MTTTTTRIVSLSERASSGTLPPLPDQLSPAVNAGLGFVQNDVFGRANELRSFIARPAYHITVPAWCVLVTPGSPDLAHYRFVLQGDPARMDLLSNHFEMEWGITVTNVSVSAITPITLRRFTEEPRVGYLPLHSVWMHVSRTTPPSDFCGPANWRREEVRVGETVLPASSVFHVPQPGDDPFIRSPLGLDLRTLRFLRNSNFNVEFAGYYGGQRNEVELAEFAVIAQPRADTPGQRIAAVDRLMGVFPAFCQLLGCQGRIDPNYNKVT